MQRPAGDCGAATQALAIDGDDFAGDGVAQGLGPGEEDFVEVGGIDQAEDAVEGVVGGNAAGQREPSLEPVLLATTPEGEVGEGLGAAERGVDADQEDVQQMVALGAAGARVGDELEFGFQVKQRLGDVIMHPNVQPKRAPNRKPKIRVLNRCHRPTYSNHSPQQPKCNRPGTLWAGSCGFLWAGSLTLGRGFPILPSSNRDYRG